jgi:hypothetical protein
MEKYNLAIIWQGRRYSRFLSAGQEGTGLFEASEFGCSEYPFRCYQFSARIEFVPGGKSRIAEILENMYVLGRHVTLRQEEHLVSIPVLGHINDDYGMTGMAASYKNVACLHFGNGNRLEFSLQ